MKLSAAHCSIHSGTKVLATLIIFEISIVSYSFNFHCTALQDIHHSKTHFRTFMAFKYGVAH